MSQDINNAWALVAARLGAVPAAPVTEEAIVELWAVAFPAVCKASKQARDERGLQ